MLDSPPEPGLLFVVLDSVGSTVAVEPFPWEHWDEHNPQPSQLPAVATYLDALPTSHRATGFLDTLGRPESGTKSWRAFVSLVGQQQAIVGEQIAAAKASDKAAFVDTVDRLEALNAKIDAAGKKAGFSKSSACIQLFG